ncbi:MAG TPA: UDP-N-acetylmuramate dehydrogenase [Candidatus Paceibacterota bacterium]|nr:UDP-N-acetylmuramate dehydrogenase [Candidatus Paceibacterota bacterium]
MPPFLKTQVPLAPYTTLGIGGPAEYFAHVDTEEKLLATLAWAHGEGLPLTVLGGGSNVLVADEGIPGVVALVDLRGIEFREDGEAVLADVGAGETWDAFVETAVLRGLFGLENLSGIPGKVGAAPVQNINAYGASVGDVIVSVRARRREDGKEMTFDHDACAFGYRDSFFKTKEGSAYVITRVTFRLMRNADATIAYRSSSQSIARKLAEAGITAPTPVDVRAAVLDVRRNIGMLEGMYRSAGSFFKNTVVTKEVFERVRLIAKSQFAEKSARFAPWFWELPGGMVKLSTAFLMECTPYNKTNFSEERFRDTVSLSPLHTLSIVNVGGATASDVRAFAETIIAAVEETFGVRIEPEVRFLPE